MTTIAKLQELLEAKHAEALALVEQIRETLAYGREQQSPPLPACALGTYADMYPVLDDLRVVYGEILILASYAAFCRQQNVADEREATE